MDETLEDKILHMVGCGYHETHYPHGGIDFDKVKEKINNMTNVELLGIISEAIDFKERTTYGR